MRAPYTYREPLETIEAYELERARLATRPPVRTVTVLRLLGEAVLIAILFFALGFALVVAGALLNPTYGV